jgi:hypothetical protein
VFKSKVHSLPPSITKIVLTFVAGAVLALFAAWFFFSTGEERGPEGQGQPEQFTEVVLSGLPALKRRWEEADAEGIYGTARWTCGELPNSPHAAPAFLVCNSHYMECWARGQAGSPAEIPVRVGEKNFHLQLLPEFPAQSSLATGARHGSWATRASLGSPYVPASGLMVVVGVREMPGQRWPMILEDVCRGVELPVRRYSYGPRAERGERIVEMDWDNDGRRLLIDRFPVSFADVNQWLLATRREQPTFEKDRTRWPLPANALSVVEQEAFCAWHGKRRLEAHLWDAATFLPANVERPFPAFVVKSVLPWTRDRRDTFFDTAKENPDWIPTAADCGRVYVKECVGRFPYRPHATDNVTWMGIHHVMGGVPERVRNPIESSKVQSLSSVRLPAADPRHQLGLRGPSTESGAFRCYREEAP